MMERVLVIGSSGAGKSTLARRLGDKTGLPVVHIDQLYWSPGWVEVPRDVYLERLRTVVDSPRWIIDGVNTSTLDLRLPRADTILFLDRSRYACLWRIARRVAGSYGKVRPDMAEGCPEQVDWAFIKFVWSFPEAYRPRIVEAFDRHQAWPRVVTLKSDAASEAFLGALPVT